MEFSYCSIDFEVKEVSFWFFTFFWVVFGLKEDFLVKEGKSVLVNQFWKINLSFWCIFGYWVIFGFGLRKTKPCYLYFTLNIRSTAGFTLLKLGFWEVGHDVVLCMS